DLPPGNPIVQLQPLFTMLDATDNFHTHIIVMPTTWRIAKLFIDVANRVLVRGHQMLILRSIEDALAHIEQSRTRHNTGIT
ncbi:MAG: hypothetical protein AAF653_13390, partial [Chloroflexota bacterium]